MKRVFVGIGVLVLSSAFFGASAFGQEEGDLRKEIEELKRNQQLMQRQLQQILQLLQSQRAPARPSAPDVEGKVFDIGDNPFKGENTAPLTLIEFTDYQ